MVLGLERAGGGHRDFDPAHAAADLSADLQELERTVRKRAGRASIARLLGALGGL